ncbi:DUF484 family protein [Caulobacter sp. 17J65-9]|uniref:DUF484 family protein n=1 Tax=Caulobacter sp. 17J65-9 TaxID=2709382 RepID=UPI003204C409
MTTQDLFAEAPTETPPAAREELSWPQVRAFIQAHPEHLLGDQQLLEMLQLKPSLAGNVVDFGRAALTRLEEAAARESSTRKAIEQVARANFAAQAQTHAVVVDLLESRNHADLARRLDAAAKSRFGLVCGVIALEKPGAVPFGWRSLEDGDVDAVLGPHGLSRLGPAPVDEELFGKEAELVKSAALVRLALWEPARHAVVAFGSPDPEGFSPEMGAELVAFLARVVERTAERWPVL